MNETENYFEDSVSSVNSSVTNNEDNKQEKINNLIPISFFIIIFITLIIKSILQYCTVKTVL